MKTLYFETKINALKAKVYHTMLSEDTFKKWTKEFSPTSRYEGNWKKGSKILFLADDKNGKANGMAGKIKENKPNEFVSIEHMGILEDGKEITRGDKAEAFAGAREEYAFVDSGKGTLLKVSMDTSPEWEDYFNETWPRALAKLKSIIE